MQQQNNLELTFKAVFIGIILSIPFVLYQGSDALKTVVQNFVGITELLSVSVTVLLLYYVYKVTTTINNEVKST